MKTKRKLVPKDVVTGYSRLVSYTEVSDSFDYRHVVGGSSYDVSGNAMVKRHCVQQSGFRPTTLSKIGTIEHQECSLRGVDSGPGSSLSIPGVSGHACVVNATVWSTLVPSIGSYVELALNVVAHFALGDHMYNAGYEASVHNSDLTGPNIAASSFGQQTVSTDRHSLENIQAYNQMLSMNSLGAHIDESINVGRGPYVFKISGQLYHWIGSLCPAEGEPSRFLQLYLYDTDNEVDNRLRHFGDENSTLHTDIVEGLIELLDAHNALVQWFRTAREEFVTQDIPDIKVRLYNVVGVTTIA
ncbi:hypothetical protein Tco_1270842 [Tanacetum coccineum]